MSDGVQSLGILLRAIDDICALFDTFIYSVAQLDRRTAETRGCLVDATRPNAALKIAYKWSSRREALTVYPVP